MRGRIMVIAGAAIALAAAGCDQGEDPRREATPNVPAESAGVPGTVSDPTRPGDTTGLDRNGASIARPTDSMIPQTGPGTAASDSMRADSGGVGR